MAGTLICTRTVSAKIIFEAAADYHITHFGGAPIILGMLVNADESDLNHPLFLPQTMSNVPVSLC